MKKLIFLTAVAMAAFSCENADITFDDFEKQTIYFPVQYPIRTISLGNDLVDNSLDREHKFHIGVVVGGFYNYNNRDWQVSFEVSPALVPDNYLKRDEGTLIALPAEYYTIVPEREVTIPKGSFSGLIQVQLADAFFQDPLALTGRYVIPLRITGSIDTKNILRGEPIQDPPPVIDHHDPTHWEVQPKDYTLFGVKYINPYHGKWLRRGLVTVRNQQGEIVDTTSIGPKSGYVEHGEIISLTTTSLTSVTSSLNINNKKLNLNERFHLILVIDENGEIKITSAANSPIAITFGTGFYKEKGDAWGGTPEKPTPRDAIYLNYFYERASGAETFVCEVCDTLVFRDRAIVYEDIRPTLVNQ
jgi:hypothetical protein